MISTKSFVLASDVSTFVNFDHFPFLYPRVIFSTLDRAVLASLPAAKVTARAELDQFLGADFQVLRELTNEHILFSLFDLFDQGIEILVEKLIKFSNSIFM